MARPFRPDRPSKPRPTFHKKEKQAKVFPGRDAYLAKTGQIASPSVPSKPSDDFIRLFLDDERPCPPGWTLVKDVAAFKDFLAEADLSKIRTISLDWYLGVGIVDGQAAAEHLASLLRERHAEFTELELIHCHSTDIPRAAEMARTLAAPIIEVAKENPDFFVMVDVGRPQGVRAW